MACARELSYSYKSTLVDWLLPRIDSGEYPGLVWEESSEKKKYFRVPWGRKNDSNCQEPYDLYRAWAEVNKRTDSSPVSDDTKRKNFRCAIQTSSFFEEIPTSLKATKKYKVFEVLSESKWSDKIEEKRIKKDRWMRKKITHDSNRYEKRIEERGESSGGASVDSKALVPNPVNLTFVPDQLPQVDILGDITTIRPPDSEDQTDRVRLERLLQVMDIPPRDSERFYQCRIIVTYNSAIAVERCIEDLREGRRVFYGDQNDQIRRLQMRKTSDEELSDFNLKGIQLPLAPESSHVMSAILEKTASGIVIGIDPETMQFFVKRLCESQAFIFDAHEQHSISSPKKLERRKKVNIFSIYQFVSHYFHLHNTLGEAQPPQVDIILAVGIKPKSRMDLPEMKGLKIELIPYVVEYFAKKSHGSVTLCYSNPSSMEQLFRS